VPCVQLLLLLLGGRAPEGYRCCWSVVAAVVATACVFLQTFQPTCRKPQKTDGTQDVMTVMTVTSPPARSCADNNLCQALCRLRHLPLTVHCYRQDSTCSCVMMVEQMGPCVTKQHTAAGFRCSHPSYHWATLISGPARIAASHLLTQHCLKATRHVTFAPQLHVAYTLAAPL
jgi:hypothetical protein